MHLVLFQILSVLGAGPSDAAAIMDALRAVAGDRDVTSIPALYRHLRRGVDEGWLVVEDVADGTPGRPRQEYRLTREGETKMREHAAWLHRFTRLAFESGPGAGGSER